MAAECPVENLLNAVSEAKAYFTADINHVLKPLLDVYWRIWSLEDLQFLTYWSDDVDKTDVLIVKDGDKPLVFEKDDYTMVVAIECIKVALIFKNTNRAK